LFTRRRPNFVGIDSFQYRAYSAYSHTYSTPARVTIQVKDNQPLATPDEYYVGVGRDCDGFRRLTGVLANDANVNAAGDLTKALMCEVRRSTIFHPDGSFSITGTSVDSDSFGYTASNTSTGGTSHGWVTIHVIDPAPFAIADSFSLDLQNSNTLRVTAPGLLANDHFCQCSSTRKRLGERAMVH